MLLSFLGKPTGSLRVLTYIIEIVQKKLSHTKEISTFDSKSYPGNKPYLIIRIVMKKLLTVSLLLFIALAANSQDVIRQKSCSNQSITLQVDSLKKVFEANGFMVLKEANMSMESEYEMPVLVPMTQGAWYHIVFIGDPGSRLHEVRMYD